MQNLWERYGLRGVAFVILALFVLLRLYQLLFQHRELKRERLRANYLGQAVLGLLLAAAALALCNPVLFGLPEDVFGFSTPDESGIANVQSLSRGPKKPLVSWTGPLAGIDHEIDRGDWNVVALKLYDPVRNGVKDAVIVRSWDPYRVPLARAYASLARNAVDHGEKSQAKQYLMASLDLVPDADLYILKASLAEPDEWKIAMDDLERASRRAKPGDYRAIEARLAIRLAHPGETRGALADVDTLLNARPSDVNLLVRRGQLRLALGAVDGAIADLESATRTRTDVATRLALADARIQKANPAQLKLALADLDKLAREVKPSDAPQDSARVFLLRAQLRLSMHASSEALPDASRAIQIDPKNADAYYFRGRIEMELDRMNAAKADLEQAAKLDPNHRRAILWHGILVYENDPKRGLADFTRALAIESDGWAHFYRGECYLRLGQRDEALAEYSEAQLAAQDETLLKLARAGAAKAQKR